MKTPTQNAAPATTTKKDKSHQISRGKEARKARRIIRQSLRYAMTTAVEDEEMTQEERDDAAAWLESNAELIDESLAYMASIKRERKAEAKAEKTASTKKARKAERKRVKQTELVADDADETEEDEGEE